MTDLIDNSSGDGISLPSGGGIAVSGDALQVSGDGILASGDGTYTAAEPSSGDSVIFGTESGGSDSLDLGSGDGIGVSGGGESVSASVAASVVTPAQRIPAPPRRPVPHVPSAGDRVKDGEITALTREEALRHFRAWLNADYAVAAGKAYTIGSRTITHEDADLVKDMLEYWRGLLSNMDEDGTVRRKTYRFIPMDF